MTDRPSLIAAVGSALAAQRPTDSAGFARPVFNHRADVLDAAAAQAESDPAWFAAQPAHTRTAIANWKAWRANNPKPQETAA